MPATSRTVVTGSGKDRQRLASAHGGAEADSLTLVVRFCTIGDDRHNAIQSSCSLLCRESRKGNAGCGNVPSEAATARQAI